jgi:hypothetical protein
LESEALEEDRDFRLAAAAKSFIGVAGLLGISPPITKYSDFIVLLLAALIIKYAQIDCTKPIRWN